MLFGKSSVHGHIDLAHGFDCLPDANETGLHDEAVARRVTQRRAALRCDLDDAFENVAELECLALDRAAFAGVASQMPVCTVPSRASSSGRFEGRVAGDEAFGQGLGGFRFKGGIGVDGLEERHGCPFLER